MPRCVRNQFINKIIRRYVIKTSPTYAELALNEAFENAFLFKKLQPDYNIVEHVFAVSHIIWKANMLAIAVERRLAKWNIFETAWMLKKLVW